LGNGPYAIVVRSPAKAELEALRVFDQRRITEAIRVNLQDDPFTPSRNRKELKDIFPAFEFEPPLWELRVGEFRVFYDGKPDMQTVYVRAIRHKPSGKTTEDITQ
jgi:mRNA-degrading endonuclease RelE of RelBE toxin-antitoxin system